MEKSFLTNVLPDSVAISKNRLVGLASTGSGEAKTIIESSIHDNTIPGHQMLIPPSEMNDWIGRAGRVVYHSDIRPLPAIDSAFHNTEAVYQKSRDEMALWDKLIDIRRSPAKHYQLIKLTLLSHYEIDYGVRLQWSEAKKEAEHILASKADDWDINFFFARCRALSRILEPGAHSRAVYEHLSGTTISSSKA